MRAPLITLVLTLALGACVETTVTTRPVSAVERGTATPLSAARAIQLFESVCGTSLPDFAGATANMAAIGVTVPSPTGTPTIFSQTEDLSFQLQRGRGGDRACSMVFGSRDGDAAVRAALARIGTFGPPPFGFTAKYRNTDAFVVYSGEQQRLGNTAYYNLRLLSEQ
jgi:hypothetical protein